MHARRIKGETGVNGSRACERSRAMALSGHNRPNPANSAQEVCSFHDLSDPCAATFKFKTGVHETDHGSPRTQQSVHISGKLDRHVANSSAVLWKYLVKR